MGTGNLRIQLVNYGTLPPFVVNSMRLAWTFEEVDVHLKGIMQNIYKNISDAAERYGVPACLGACLLGKIRLNRDRFLS